MKPAILVISKHNYGSIKNGTYFKCYPHDKSGPFLVPFKTKTDFSKKLMNYYVIIEPGPLEDGYAKLIETLGPVSDIPSFNKYQLHTEGLIKKKDIDYKNPDLSSLVDNTDRHVYTLDPEGTRDFDDAFSLKDLEDGTQLLSIYISNPTYFINPKSDFSKINVSSIYLQEYDHLNVYNMLPKKLVEKLSLIENGRNAVLTLDLIIKDGKISEYNSKMYNSVVLIKKNLVYGSNKGVIKRMSFIVGNILDMTSIDDHKMIEILMVYFNLYAGSLLSNSGAIFRFLQKSENIITEHDHYGTYSKEKIVHQMFTEYHKLPHVNGLYIHISSPIRRLVDTFNMFIMQDVLDHGQNIDIDLDILNKQSKIIKKIQNRSKLLCMFHSDPDAIYSGQIISNNSKKYDVLINNGIYSFKSDYDLEIGSEHQFKIYVFSDKANYKQKIQISMTDFNESMTDL